MNENEFEEKAEGGDRDIKKPICELGLKGCCIAPLIPSGKRSGRKWFNDGFGVEPPQAIVGADYWNCPVLKNAEYAVRSNKTSMGTIICPKIGRGGRGGE